MILLLGQDSGAPLGHGCSSPATMDRVDHNSNSGGDVKGITEMLGVQTHCSVLTYGVSVSSVL